MESGGHRKLKFALLRALAFEQAYVVRSDTASLAFGLNDKHGAKNDAYKEFFGFFHGGEVYAGGLHEQLLKYLAKQTDEHTSDADAGILTSSDVFAHYSPNPRCQSYPSYFCRLISHAQPAAIALAFCVNFP